MNHEEVKNVLLLYRPDMPDADDPQIAEALALAKRDPGLSEWLAEHCARQKFLREKFGQIQVPAGLKEQIISERAAHEKVVYLRLNFALVAAAVVVAAIVLAALWFRPSAAEDTLAVFEQRMTGIALRGYGMDLETNDLGQIRTFLAKNSAPSDFVLPAKLGKVTLTGCAIENWRNARVSMICFRSGKPLPPGEQSDLWLFVVDRASVKNLPADFPQFSKINRLNTVAWTEGGRLYFLGTESDERSMRQLL